MRLLLLVEESTIDNALKNKPPNLSHELNLLAIARAALARGFKINVQQKGDVFCRSSRFFELIAVDGKLLRLNKTSRHNLNYDLIVSCFLDALAGAKILYPAAKNICMIPALYFVENPTIWRNDHWINSANSLRNDVDIITFQNFRMKEIAFPFYHLMSRWVRKDRMLIAPLGPEKIQIPSNNQRSSARYDLGFKDDDIVILNAGGVYKWTDFLSFLTAFLNYVEAGNTKLKLILPGLKQKQNSDHDEYLKEVMTIISEKKTAFESNVYYEPNWDIASLNMEKYLEASDIGLNVNSDGLENWQSHRVRCVEYLSRGMPFITTDGDLHANFRGKNGVFVVQSENLKSYHKVFDLLIDGRRIADAKLKVKKYSESMLQDKVYKELLDQIISTSNEPREKYVSGQHVLASSKRGLGLIKFLLKRFLTISRLMRRIPVLKKLDRMIRSYPSVRSFIDREML